MSIKNFSISGIGPSVTLGKGGPTLAANGSDVELNSSPLVTEGTLGTSIGDYLTANDYVDETALASALTGYVDTAALSTALADYLSLAGGTMTGNIVLGANKITTSATSFANNELVSKAYVDGVAQGLDIKQSVRVASTANIVISTGGLVEVDGITVEAGDRVLVKNQFGNEQAGIYIVAVGAWTRAPDADTNGKLNAGSFVFVEEGDTQADTGWVITTDNPITIGTTPITWTQFSAAGDISLEAGDGISVSGSTVTANVDGTTLTNDGGTGGQIAVRGGTIGQVLVSAGPSADAAWGAVPGDSSKADKVAEPTDGNLAALDGSGNLTDSGFAAEDFQPVDADLTAIAALSGDGLIRKTSGTYAMDSTTYLTSLSGAVLANGTVALTANWDVGGSFTITNLAAPSNDSDAATKEYVDDAISGASGDNTGRILVATATRTYDATGDANLVLGLVTGAIVHRIIAKVTTVFNGTTPTLTIGYDGTSTDADGVHDGSGIDLTQLGTYVVDSYYASAQNEDITSGLTIGGSPSTGAVTLIVEYSLPVV